MIAFESSTGTATALRCGRNGLRFATDGVLHRTCDDRFNVAGAGHMVAGDRNDRFVAALLPFLERVRAALHAEGLRRHREYALRLRQSAAGHRDPLARRRDSRLVAVARVHYR